MIAGSRNCRRPSTTEKKKSGPPTRAAKKNSDEASVSVQVFEGAEEISKLNELVRSRFGATPKPQLKLKTNQEFRF